MADFTVIKESDAPRPARQTGRLAARMREYEKFVDAVGAGKVGKLTPNRGETGRGVALRISRAAKRQARRLKPGLSMGRSTSKSRSLRPQWRFQAQVIDLSSIT
ncbi:MAG: hypothetical protein IPF51_12685 [Dehalococcoidia bacterium]|uniref:hypothetical protein n=1 Tax=Candidatus Amarobacter glycogenicus TaxID=3140699 RepID=UPI003136BD33|nr:hypothetical protein [Dehalococcoidia bacterium]